MTIQILWRIQYWSKRGGGGGGVGGGGGGRGGGGGISRKFKCADEGAVIG